MADQARPDAIMYHQSMKRGATSVARSAHIQKLLGPRLGGDQFTSLGPAHGGRVFSCDVEGGWWFARLDHTEPYKFPYGHDYAGMPRYRWEDQPDGTRHGFLLSPEEVERQAHAEAPAATQARKAALAQWKERQDAHCQKLQRWRELVPRGSSLSEAERQELNQLQVEIFGDPAEAAAAAAF